MRHQMRGRKLSRTTPHRLALFRNQFASLVEYGRIVTTLAKAKELRPVAERLISAGRREGLNARRRVGRWLVDRELQRKLFEEIAPRFEQRPGGYLRIVKLAPRKGDGAEMAILEFVDEELIARPEPKPEVEGDEAAELEAPQAEAPGAPPPEPEPRKKRRKR